MATEGVDVSSMQDEDVLRRMWQETEDLTKKKEIRARMYKLREQRLKEFYTTGEVLLDVQRATPQSHEIIDSSEDFVNNSPLIPVTTPTKTIMTHTDSIKDRGFITMKSQEIRDSEFPPRNHHQVFQGNGASDGRSYWTVQSSSASYQSVGRDGQYEVTSQSQSRNMAGENGRIVMDSGYGSENKSVVDRNGDVRVISSRAYDTSGRDISVQGIKGSEMNLRREINMDDFNDGNVRYLEDVNGGRTVSRSTTGSNTSETRTSSSSVTSQKWSTDVKTSSSRITSSSRTTREGSSYDSGTGNDVYYVEKFDSSDGALQPYDAGSQVPKRGTTEVKKTIIRGGKVITETITYVDGKPVGGSKTTTTTRDLPPETVTVIRGGKLIKDTVPSKTTDSQHVITEKRTKSTTSDSKGSVQSFVTTERMTTESHKGGNYETMTRTDRTEPDWRDSDVPYEQTPNGKLHPVNQGQAPPQTKTIIRGGKVIKEKIPSDVDETKDFIRRESSTTERTNNTTQRKSDSVNRTSTFSETASRTTETRRDHRTHNAPDDDNDYPNDHHEPHNRQRDDRPEKQRQSDQTRPREEQPKRQDLSDVEDSVYDRRSSSDSKTTTTKTITVIRGGKVMKQTVVEVDGKQVSDTGKPLRPHDDDAGRRSPSVDDVDRHAPRKSQPGDRDRSHPEIENITRDQHMTVKTIKTVIRGGKLVKEAVPVDDVAHVDRDVPADDYEKPGKPRKGSPESDHPGRTDGMPRFEEPRDSRPGEKSPNREKPTKQRPQRDDSPDDDTEDLVRVVKGSTTDVRKSTSQKTQQHSTEVKTVTVIRGGKIVKEKVTVTDDEDTERTEKDRSQRLSPETTSKTPKKTQPANEDTGSDNRKPKKSSPEARHPSQKKTKPDGRSKQPGDKHPSYDVPSDREGSEYPSGSEAPDQEEEMPYKVVTVIRSGKLIKECVPISDDEMEGTDSRGPKPSKSSKGPRKEQDKPFDIHPVQGIPSTDRRKPGDKEQPKGMRPEGKIPETDGERPDSRRKGEKPREPGDVPTHRRPSHSDLQDYDEDHSDNETTGSRPQDYEKPSSQKSPKDKRPSGVDEPEDEEPDIKTPQKDVKKPQKSGTPDKKKPGKPIKSDTDERTTKTVTVIRGGKVITETVKMTDEEIRERNLMESETKTTKKTSREDVDFIEAEKPKKDHKPKSKPDDADDDDVPGREKPRRSRSPSPKDKTENLKDFIQREKSTGVKTVTVIRSGKIIKEVVPVDDDEPGDETRKPDGLEPHRKPSEGKPNQQKPKKGKGSPDKMDERPGSDYSDDEIKRPQGRQPDTVNKRRPDDDEDRPDRISPGKSGRRPQDDKPDENERSPQDDYPSRRSPDKTSKHPQKVHLVKDGRVPEKDEPDRRSPDKTGRRPGKDLESRKPQDGRPYDSDGEPDTPGKTRRQPEDQPDRCFSEKDGRRPYEDYPEGMKPQDEPNRRSPNYTAMRPGEDHPHSPGRRPQDHHPDEPGENDRRPQDGHPVKFSPTTGRRPDDELKRPPSDISPGEDGRRPRDGHPDKFSPTTARKPEDEIKRQPSDVRPGNDRRKPQCGQPDRFSPTTGKKPDDEIKKKPSDTRPGDDSRRPRDGQPDRFPTTTGKKPEDELKRQPSDVRPGDENRRPRGDTPDGSPRQPVGIHPDGHRSEHLVDKEFINKEKSSTVKTVTVIRGGKLVKETVPADDDEPESRPRPEPHAEPFDKKHHKGDQPEYKRPDDDSRKPREGEPEGFQKPGKDKPSNRSPQDGHPDDRTPVGRPKYDEPVDRRPQDGRPQNKYETQPDDSPDRRSPDKLRSPNEVYPDDASRKPYDKHPSKPGKHPQDDRPSNEGKRPKDGVPDHFGETGRRPEDRLIDDHPNKHNKRPEEDEPGRIGRRPGEDYPIGHRPQDDYADDFRPDTRFDQPKQGYPDEKSFSDSETRLLTPQKPGRSPYDEPVEVSPVKMGKYPGEDYPDDKTRRPKDKRPDDISPNRNERHPEDDRLDRFSPDKTDRRPSDDQPGVRSSKYDSPDRFIPERPGMRPENQYHLSGKPYENYPQGMSPDGTRRQPGDDQPNEYNRKPVDRYPQELDRRPRDDYPDDMKGRPGHMAPDKTRKKPTDTSPNRLKRKPSDRPDKISPGKRPDGQPDRRRPTESKRSPDEPSRPTKTPSTKPKGKKPDETRVDETHWTLKSDKISVDVSASHAQFASSLRAPPLDKPEPSNRPLFDDYHTPKSTPSTRSVTPKQMTRTPLTDSTPKPRDKYPKGTTQRPKSPWTDEPQYTTPGRKPRRDDSPNRITQRPSSKISDVISRLTSDTQSSKERRRLTSRQSRSSITKRTRTPGVSPSTSPTRGKPRSDDIRKRTTSSGSTSTVSTEQDSDFNYQRPERSESEILRDVQVSEFIRTEKDHSRTVQRVQGVSPDDEDYPTSPGKPRDKSPGDYSDTSFPRGSRPQKPKESYPDDTRHPIDRKPKDDFITTRKPVDENDDDDDDTPRKKKPSDRPEEDRQHPSKRPNSFQRSKSPVSGRPRSPSDRQKPRDRSPRSGSRSPQRKLYPESPKDRKPKAPEKATPLQKGISDRPKKELTEFPSQKRFPAKEKVPQVDKTKPKTPGTRPGDRPIPGTPTNKRPDLSSPKSDPTKPWQRPQNGIPSRPETNRYPKGTPVNLNRMPETTKKPKTPTSLQPETSKVKPGTPIHSIPGKKPVGRIPSSEKMPKGRRPSEDDDFRKLNEFAKTTRCQTTTSTIVETRNLINSESGRRSTTRKNIMDFDWNNDTPRDDFLVDDSPVGSRENISPTGKPKRRPSSPEPKSKRPNDKTRPSSQSTKPRSKSPLDKPKGIPKDQLGSKKKKPKRPGSESSEYESDEDVPIDVEFIHDDRKPQKIKDDKYREQIDLIRREQETNYSTKVITSQRDTHEEFTGRVEMPDSSRESTRSPDVNRPKCVPVNERDTEEIRPRYADQVSEPEDESEFGRQKPEKRPGLRPVEEESKKTLRDILVKTTMEKIDRIPDLCDVTDEAINVSVAERVNKFMETALKPNDSQPSRPEDITLKGLDDTINEFIQTNEFGDDVTDLQHRRGTPSSVIKAKTMFETIANQTVVTGTAKRDLQRQDDILSRPSVLGPKSPRPNDSKPGRLNDEPESVLTKGRPRGNTSDESPDRSKSPKGRWPTDEDDDRKQRTQKPGTRDTSPKRGNSPGRHRKSPSRYPDDDDDEDDRKPHTALSTNKDSPSRQKPKDVYGRSPDRSPDRHGTKPRRFENRPEDHSPDRYGTSPKRPSDKSDQNVPYDKSPRRPGDRSPDRYDKSPRRPGDRSPDRYDKSPRRPGDRSPDRYDKSPRRPGDRSPDRHDKSPRRPGERSPDRYGSSPSRPSDRSPDRHTRKPGDRPSGSPERCDKSPRRPGERSPDRYGSSPKSPNDRTPDRYGKAPKRPDDKPGDRSRDRYDSSPSRPSDRSPDRYIRKPGDRPSGSPERYDDTPRRPGDRSPDRYDKSSRRPGDRSPDRYGSTPKKPGDRSPTRSPDRYEGTSKRPRGRPNELSPVRRPSDSTFKKPGDRPEDRDAPKRHPGEKISPKKPGTTTDRYSPSLKDKPKVKTPTPDRFGSVPGSGTKKPQNSSTRPEDTSSPRDSHTGTKSPYTTPGRETRVKGQVPDRNVMHSTRPSQRPEDRDYESRYSTPGRAYSPDPYRPGNRDRSPGSRYSPSRSPFDRDTSPSRRPMSYSTPEPVPAKKSPSKELADQVRRLSSPKKDSPVSSKPETSQQSYPKTPRPEPIRSQKMPGVVDKYSLLDYDKRTTTSTTATKYTTSHTLPLFPSRTSPDRKTKPLFESKPKTNGYLTPEDDLVSPTFEKTKKIPENSSLKAPALLKKQNSQPDSLRYTRPIKEDDDRYPTGRIPSTTSLGNKPFTTTDTTKVSKFGISLKKTSPGNNFIRKGPVDVGKKETELDRTYDLDLLNAMLERAKGYEERRLIRGQIRTVKTMIENNELTPRRRPYEVDHDATYRPTTKAPLKSSPLDQTGYGPEGYGTYRRTETTTTTETRSVRTSSPEKYYPREDSPGRYTMKSTATLTLSPKDDSPLRRSPDKQTTSSFPDRRSPDKSYPGSGYGDEPSRPGTRKYTPDREPVGKLIDSETRKLLKRPGSPKKGTPHIPDVFSVSKTIKKSHSEHETKETNLTDSIISSYGVGPTDDKGRPLFGLQALRRQKKPETEPADFKPKEPESPVDIRDSSGRAFFGLRALRAPKKDTDLGRESPTLKDVIPKYDSHSIGSPRRHSLRGSPLSDDDDTGFLRKEMDEEEVNRVMGEPGQSLKEMIRKHERLMEDDDRRTTDKTKTSSSSYSTSTVIRSSAVKRPDGTVSVRKNIIRGETTAKDDQEPQTRVTTEEYSYETPREPLDEVDDTYGRRSIKSINSRSSISDSVHDKHRSTVTYSVKSPRKSVSPERESSSSFHRPHADDYARRREETDLKSPTSRSSIADRLTQLSKKFSNDSLDKSLANKRDAIMDNKYTSYTSKTSSTYRSTIDGGCSPLTGSENGVHERRYSSTQRDDDGCRRGSSTPIEDVKETLYRKFSGSEEVEHTAPSFTRVGKGGSVKALSQKFQQAAADAESPKPGASSYPKAGLILRSTSFKQTNGELTSPDSPGLKQSISMEVRVGSPSRSGSTVTDYPNERSRGDVDRSWSPNGSTDRRVITQTTTEIRSDSSGGRSFLGNTSKVTGVQDIISRMRAADQESVPNDSANDSEARALLNKFLGASVMMSGMEPLVKASGANSSTLVSQVERQRILESPTRDGYREIVTTTTETRKSSDNIDDIWDEKTLRQLLDDCTDYEGRRKLRARIRTVMAEKSACEDLVAADREDKETNSKNVHLQDSDFAPRTDSLGSSSRVTSKTTYTTTTSTSTSSTNKTISPFAKFQQLDRQNSSSAPSSPSAGKAPLFTFTDPKLCRSASGAKDRLLQWCQIKTKDYKNIKIENFSTSWSDGLAFCALIHHFRPEAFDYDALTPKERKKNFELAFRVAEEQANIAPLLDVEDMVMMRKPDWKCVFTYVQSIYHRFKNEEI